MARSAWGSPSPSAATPCGAAAAFRPLAALRSPLRSSCPGARRQPVLAGRSQARASSDVTPERGLPGSVAQLTIYSRMKPRGDESTMNPRREIPPQTGPEEDERYARVWCAPGMRGSRRSDVRPRSGGVGRCQISAPSLAPRSICGWSPVPFPLPWFSPVSTVPRWGKRSTARLPGLQPPPPATLPESAQKDLGKPRTCSPM
jgi:hypothetical protein